MIRVHAHLRPGRFRLHIDGHAPRDTEEGPNIPCAAVSTIVQTVLAGLQAVQHQYPEAIKLKIDYRDN